MAPHTAARTITWSYLNPLSGNMNTTKSGFATNSGIEVCAATARYQEYFVQQHPANAYPYYSGKSVDCKIRETISHAEILLRKKRLKEAGKVLLKAKELVRMYGRYPQLLEIVSWERELLLSPNDIHTYETLLYQNLAEEKGTLEQIGNIHAYTSLLFGISLATTIRGDARAEEELGRMDEMITHLLLANVESALRFKAMLMFYHNHIYYGFAKRNQQHTYKLNKRLVILIEEHPERMRDRMNIYIVALNNLLVAQLEMGMYDDFTTTLQTMKSLPGNWIEETADNNNMTVSLLARTLELNYHVQAASLNRGLWLHRSLSCVSPSLKGLPTTQANSRFTIPLHTAISAPGNAGYEAGGARLHADSGADYPHRTAQFAFRILCSIHLPVSATPQKII